MKQILTAIFLPFMPIVDRGPNKRRIKPVEKHIIDVPIIADDSEEDEDYYLENDGKLLKESKNFILKQY